MAIQVGDKAPDFELRDNHGATVRLSDFRGEKNVVVLFYPFAFTGVCTGELCELRDNLPKFVNDLIQANKSRLQVTVRLPGLPYNLVINSAETTDSGLRVIASARDVPLSSQ